MHMGEQYYTTETVNKLAYTFMEDQLYRLLAFATIHTHTIIHFVVR